MCAARSGAVEPCWPDAWVSWQQRQPEAERVFGGRGTRQQSSRTSSARYRPLRRDLVAALVHRDPLSGWRLARTYNRLLRGLLPTCAPSVRDRTVDRTRLSRGSATGDTRRSRDGFIHYQRFRSTGVRRRAERSSRHGDEAASRPRSSHADTGLSQSGSSTGPSGCRELNARPRRYRWYRRRSSRLISWP